MSHARPNNKSASRELTCSRVTSASISARESSAGGADDTETGVTAAGLSSLRKRDRTPSGVHAPRHARHTTMSKDKCVPTVADASSKDKLGDARPPPPALAGSAVRSVGLNATKSVLSNAYDPHRNF